MPGAWHPVEEAEDAAQPAFPVAGGPVEAELAVEQFFPADERTRELLRAEAAR